MNRYSLPTTWRLAAPIERVWEAIHDYRAWPSWWPEIAGARRVAAGDADGVGEVSAFVFRAPLGYKLRFRTETVRSRPPFELDGRASGDLEGTGRWRLAREGEGTVVRYQWDVRTTIPWMNLFAPLLRPFFVRSHVAVMASGEAHLRRLLARQAATASPARR